MPGSLKTKNYWCYIRKKSKNANKKRKNENFEKQKNAFFSHVSVARVQTDRQTHRQTDRQTDTKVNTEDTLSGFQEFFLQPFIKDRSNSQLSSN